MNSQMVQLKSEFNYYLDHQDELVCKYKGQSVAIYGNEVIGVYDSEFEAIIETSKVHELGTFLVQKCEPGTNNYMQRYHSRVA